MLRALIVFQIPLPLIPDVFFISFCEPACTQRPDLLLSHSLRLARMPRPSGRGGHACGCASPFRAHVWPTPCDENMWYAYQWYMQALTLAPCCTVAIESKPAPPPPPLHAYTPLCVSSQALGVGEQVLELSKLPVHIGVRIALSLNAAPYLQALLRRPLSELVVIDHAVFSDDRTCPCLVPRVDGVICSVPHTHCDLHSATLAPLPQPRPDAPLGISSVVIAAAVALLRNQSSTVRTNAVVRLRELSEEAGRAGLSGLHAQLCVLLSPHSIPLPARPDIVSPTTLAALLK